MALRLLAILSLALQVATSLASNTWINHRQQYYKFPVVSKGIYRISYADLQTSGISTGDFDPRNLQIFYQGNEIPLYVNTESDGIFQADDFIEFVAFPNDGALDSSNYTAGDQLNPYLSLYNDTAWYFLTWNTLLKNKRYVSVSSSSIGENVSFCVDVYQKNYINRYNYPVSSPEFGPAEGYTSNYFNKGQSFTEPVTLAGYTSLPGITTKCHYSLATVSSYMHSLSFNFAGAVSDSSFWGHHTVRGKLEGMVPADGKAVFVASIPSTDHASTDIMAVSYLRLTYPRTLVAKTDSLTDGYLPLTGKGTFKTVRFSGLRNGDAVLYDVTEQRRSVSIATANSVAFNVANAEMNYVFVGANGGYIQVGRMSPVQSKNSLAGTFADFSQKSTQAQYVIITHRSLWDAAQEYATYRSLAGLSTTVIDIDELYAQFGYGVQKHPLAIREFAQYIFSNWTTKPEYIFIIGKGVHAANYRRNSTNYRTCLVPSAGSPSADMINFEGIGGDRFHLPFAVGRLAARTPEDVRNYLAKVQEHEQQLQAEWMKNVLHFGGGSDAGEQTQFKAYLSEMESIIEGDSAGATVYTTLKNSSDPLEITKTDIVRNKIESGVSMMTFFGHASSGSFDQSIDEPTYFNNRGKYPFILANSCYSGDIFTPESNSISERWMMIANKGSIAFLASVGTGTAYYLNRYSNKLYQNLSFLSYGNSLGNSIKNTVNAFNLTVDGQAMVQESMDLNFHGDPAVKLHFPARPDFVATERSVLFPATRITADVDSFTIAIAILNIGKSFSDTINIELSRTMPDGSMQIQKKSVLGLKYRDTIDFTFATGGIASAGSNKLELYIDRLDVISELNETNNASNVTFTIFSRQLIPVYPEEFAIVPSIDVTLSASALDPSGFSGECYFEIDTKHDFSSPTKRSASIAYDNSLIRWKPDGLQTDMTYYWRVGTRKQSESPIDWNASSFRVETGKTGWAQYGYGQAKSNTFAYCGFDAQEKLNFIIARKMLTCLSVGSPVDDLGYYQTQFRIDGSVQGSSGCGVHPFVTVAVIDPVSLEPWSPKTRDYGHYNYSSNCRANHLYFEFDPQSESQKDAFVRFVNDSVPDGFYVLVYTFISGKFKSWNDNMYSSMEQLGASSVRSHPDNNPYIFFVKKGDPKSAREVLGETSTETIELNVRLESNASYGWMQSPSIGPTSKWDKSLWHWEMQTGDSSSLSIVGINPDGTETIISDTLTSGDFDLLSLVSRNIKLRSLIADKSSKTQPSFNFWKVYYTPVPETALSLRQEFKFHADTLTEGDSVLLSLATENISYTDMDSLLVRYSVHDMHNSLVYSRFKRLAPHAAGSVAVGAESISTTGLSGKYTLHSEFNPQTLGSLQYDQYERYHFNNIFEKQFVVRNDVTAPLLNVTFDGARILNGEIVSAKPVIEIAVYDENKFLLIDDTSMVEVYLIANSLKTYAEQRIYFIDSLGREQISFAPATVQSGKAVLSYKPIFEKDGTFTLRIKAWDKKRNASEMADYKVSFQIITHSSITHLFNYPNPFSTSTRFIFTLTGSELPDDLRIQIMTVSGKFVREIGLAELGPLRVGNNVTQFAWDGTDQFGDKLANGIYYYRVFSKLHGEQIEHRNSDADNLFKQGYGKMVLIR